MKNFELTKDSDIFYQIAKRTINGRMTKQRYANIRKFVRTYNHNASAPYGLSPKGYPYRCGCTHDCCGCLVREHLEANFTNNQTTLFLIKTFNY